MGWWESPDYKDQDCYSATTLAQGLARQALKKAQCHATFFTSTLLVILSAALLFLSLLLCCLPLLLSLLFLLFPFVLLFLRALLLNGHYFWSPQSHYTIFTTGC
jgi:hypothetical protein